ncbi:MAG TPA: helix-turn-helix transcriptional regulator [Sphingomicrobium sp.]|nr:helix-turn-helix transcriptional regulator [Sphingomicrobium sp.]
MQSRSVLARNLRRLRDERGLNQVTFADEAGIDRSYLSDLENGRYAASLDMLDAIAVAFGVRPCELIDEKLSFSRQSGAGQS